MAAAGRPIPKFTQEEAVVGPGQRGDEVLAVGVVQRAVGLAEVLLWRLKGVFVWLVGERGGGIVFCVLFGEKAVDAMDASLAWCDDEREERTPRRM